MKRPFGRGITPVKGLAITMLINHLLTGMILQVYSPWMSRGVTKACRIIPRCWYCQMRLVHWLIFMGHVEVNTDNIHGCYVYSMDLSSSWSYSISTYTIHGWYVICNVFFPANLWRSLDLGWILLHICQNKCVLIIINQQHQHTGETTGMRTEQIWTNRNA